MTITNISFNNISIIGNDSVIINDKVCPIPEYVKRNGSGITINTGANGQLYFNGYELTADEKFVFPNPADTINTSHNTSAPEFYDDISFDEDDFLDELDLLLELSDIF